MSSISNLEMLEDEIELLKSLEQITIAINLNHGEKSLHPYTKVCYTKQFCFDYYFEGLQQLEY